MKAFLHPLALAFAAVAIVGAVLNSLPFVIGGTALWIGTVAFVASRHAQNQLIASDVSNLSPEARMLIKPIRQASEELAQVVASSSQSPTVKVIGAEALTESRQIVIQAYRLAELRTQLAKTLRGRSEAVVQIERLRAKLEESDDELERAALVSALEAHQKEAGHYDSIDTNIDKIDSRLRQAQAALSELKARIAVSAVGARAESAEQEELSEMMGRLKALSTSFDEAEAMSQEQIH